MGIWFLVFGVALFAMLVATMFQTGFSGIGAILWTLPSALTGFIFAAYGLYVFLIVRSKPADAEADRGRINRQSRLVLLAFFAFVGSTISMGGLYLHEITQTIRQERFTQAATVAGLKAQLVEKWLVERSAEMETASASLIRVQRKIGVLDDDEQQMAELLFAEWMARNPERRGAWLFGAGGKVLVGAGGDPRPEEIQAAVAALRDTANRTLKIVELAGDRPDHIWWTFVLPMFDPATKTVTSVLAARVNPELVLYPELDRPVPGIPNEEIGLIKRDGNMVVLIKPPKNSSETPGQRIPLTDLQRPVVQAVLQGNGVRESVDYAGTPVFSASHQVGGTPWTVVVKVPQADLSEPVWDVMSSMGAHLAGSVVVAGLVLFVLWAMQQTEMASVKTRHMEEHAALVRHYESMVQGARDIVVLADPEGRIVDANLAAVAAYGYTLEELGKLRIRDLRAPAALADLDAQWKQSDSVRGSVYETVHRRKDGTTFPVEVSNNIIEVNGRIYHQGYIRDITRRKTLETEVQRLSRVQTALQEATSLLLRAQTEDELYRGMCEEIVKVGGYRMAIVALANEDADRTFRVAAFTGPYAGALHRPDVRWGEGEYSEGTVGTAVRTGTVQVNQNVAATPDAARWRDELLSEGVQAYVGLPLRVDGKVIGALAIYSDIRYAFDRAEVEFLTQLADDVSYGVTALRAKAAAANAPRAAG